MVKKKSTQTNSDLCRFIVFGNSIIAVLGLLKAVYYGISFGGENSLERVASAVVATGVLLIGTSALFAIARTRFQRWLTILNSILLVWLAITPVSLLGKRSTYLDSNLFSVYIGFGIVILALAWIAWGSYATTARARWYLSRGLPVLAVVVAGLTLWLQMQVHQNFTLQTESTTTDSELGNVVGRNSAEPSARNESIVTDMRLKANSVVKQIKLYTDENGTLPSYVEPPAGYTFTDYRVVSNYKIEICMEPVTNMGSFLPIVVQPNTGGRALFWYDFSSTGCTYTAGGYTELHS